MRLHPSYTHYCLYTSLFRSRGSRAPRSRLDGCTRSSTRSSSTATCTGGSRACCPARSRSRRHISSATRATSASRSEEHTSELQSRPHLVCRLLLEKKKITYL